MRRLLIPILTVVLGGASWLYAGLVSRPTKTCGTTTYTAEVAAGCDTILAAEVDADINAMITGGINNIETANINGAGLGTAAYANGSVTGVKLADSAVTTTKINDGAVTTPKLADAPNGVTAAKINDGEVTGVKIANGAITAPKIADGGTFVQAISGENAIIVSCGVAFTTVHSLPIITTRSHVRYSVHMRGTIGATPGSTGGSHFRVVRDATTLYTSPTINTLQSTLGEVVPWTPSVTSVDTIAPGAHTYSVQCERTLATTFLGVNAFILLEEIP